MTVVIVNVALGPGLTLYVRIGNLLGWVCVGATLTLAALSMLGRRKGGSEEAEIVR